MKGVNSLPVTIVAEYIPADNFRAGLSIAHFNWPDLQPRDTYTIALDNFVSLELDGHLPVRPSAVSLYDDADKTSKETLSATLGEEFTRLLESARFLGVSTLSNYALSEEQRRAIAVIQQNSPSTPPILRGLTLAMQKESETVRTTITAPDNTSSLRPRLLLPFMTKKAA